MSGIGVLEEIDESLRSIAASMKRIADVFCGVPGQIVATHTDPIPRSSTMAKAKTLKQRVGSKMRAGGGTDTQKDTVTISILDTGGNPFPADGATLTAVSADPATLAINPAPVGMEYGEDFLKSGTVVVTATVAFADGSPSLATDDTVTITGTPGSLVATHSGPVPR